MNVVAGLGPRMDKPLVFKQAVRVQHSADTHVALPAEFPNRWQPIARTVGPIENHPAHAPRNALVQLSASVFDYQAILRLRSVYRFHINSEPYTFGTRQPAQSM